MTVRDEADQARCIVERILENRETGTLLKQQAVLFRTSSHSGPLEVELTRRNIPFVKFGGLKFLDAAHVKDMLALLRFVENPQGSRGRLPADASDPGRRPGVGATRARSHDRGRRSGRATARGPGPAARRRALERVHARGRADLRQSELAGRSRTRPAVVCAASRAHPRGCQHPPGRPDPARTDRQRLSLARALSSPNSRSIRPTPPATSQAFPCSTRTI